MSGPFLLFVLNQARSHELEESPRLASWDATQSPRQQALRRYLDHVEEHVDAAGASALHLVVPHSMADASDRGYDLDNYLYPVVHRFGPNRFDLARASSNSRNRIIVGRALPDPSVVAEAAWRFVSATTTASAERAAWKAEVHEQVAAAVTVVPTGGPIGLEVAFRIGPGRTWANLWKPAIDSLGPILGEGKRPFAPRDDLIAELGLHREVIPGLGHRVELGIWWRDATPE